MEIQRAQHITKCIFPTQKLVGKEQGMDLSLSAMAKKNKTKDRFRYCRKCSFSTTHLCLAPDERQVNVGKHREAQIYFCFAFLQCCACILIYSTSITEKGCAMGWRKIMELTEGMHGLRTNICPKKTMHLTQPQPMQHTYTHAKQFYDLFVL